MTAAAPVHDDHVIPNVDPDGSTEPLLIACLCAAWCRTCDDYRATFDAVTREFGDRVRVLWVDIEDDEDALGGVDVVDFPTLLIARGDHIAFYGPVLPHAQALRQLADRGLLAALGRIDHPALAGLPGRLRRL
jgi:thiol-disulfide isomerase/thioredoxin